MAERNAVIGSTYFDRHEIDLRDDEIVVVSCMRNEADRLPYFLDYYRRLGVSRFLLIDNDSTDDTREYLLTQPDVEYFHTSASFRGSAAGRLWTQEVSQTYALGHWVLTVDADEFLVYPGVERFGLRTLCAYLDERGYEGLYTPMLDMHSDLPLSQTHLERGADPLEVCPFFQTDTYALHPMADPPFLGVFGGPRASFFEGSGQSGLGPLYTKVPLVKWREGFSYIRVAHTQRALQLADVTGVLLHFKFVAAWAGSVARDVARGDRRQVSLWERYAEHATDDLCFYGPQSRRYTGPRDLVVLGVMAAPAPLRTFYRTQLSGSEADAAAIDDMLPAPVRAEGGFHLRAMAALWPFVHNPGIMRHFGHDEPRGGDYRARLLQELRRHFTVVDAATDHILVRIDEPALHRWRRSGLMLAAYVGGTLAGQVMADGSAPGLVFDTTTLEPSVCRWSIDLDGAARTDRAGAGDGPVTLSVYLLDGGDPASSASGREGDPWPRPEDALIFSAPWSPRPAAPGPAQPIDGMVHGFDNGELLGWAYDASRQSFDVPVAVYVNDRLVAVARPTVQRPALAQRVGAPEGTVGRGFRVPLPLGYFHDNGVTQARIVVRAAGTNVSLRRTPIELPTDTRTATWTKDDGWRAAPR